jgi:PadR family transcriptional regulator, regulatory protein PadR
MLLFSKDLVAATSVPLILTILSAGESYGYEIIKTIKEMSGGSLEFAEGTLYPVLKKLEEKKFISSAWKTAANDRQRKYYRISAAGKKQLEAEKQNWQFINEIFEKLWNSHINFSYS